MGAWYVHQTEEMAWNRIAIRFSSTKVHSRWMRNRLFLGFISTQSQTLTVDTHSHQCTTFTCPSHPLCYWCSWNTCRPLWRHTPVSRIVDPSLSWWSLVICRLRCICACASLIGGSVVDERSFTEKTPNIWFLRSWVWSKFETGSALNTGYCRMSWNMLD